jgi:hypothetical protein
MQRQSDTVSPPDSHHPPHSERGDDPAALEAHIAAVGDDLLAGMRALLEPIHRTAPGPQALARTLGVDKVLTSRVLKAMRCRDPLTATHCMPGPEPLRRLIKAAGRRGADPAAVADASRAVDSFEILIRDRIGDRSLLDAILSAWVPEARREFELRRKQSAFKALSQLRGVQAESLVAAAVISPSAADPRLLDVVWVNGVVGLHRVRPGVGVKITTRRMPTQGVGGRQPRALDGRPISPDGDPTALILPDFCSTPTPRLNVRRVGDVVQYTLADNGFGPSAAVDLFFAEANFAELPRYLPADLDHKTYFFAEVVTPAVLLQFDVLVHESLYPASESSGPALRIYDTSFEGVASVNDPSRDIDRLDMLESIEPLGAGLARFRSGAVPRYTDLLRHVLAAIGADESRYRGYRCRIDYPVYGSQVAMVFEPQREPAPQAANTTQL